MSFAAIVQHDIPADKFAEAQERITSNGLRMAAQPGYRARYLLRPTGGDDVIVTVTLWDDEGAYNSWVNLNRANNPHAGKPAPYIGDPRTALYDIVAETLPVSPSGD